MSEKRLLNLSNKVHVLNTEVSHLQAEVDKVRQHMEGNSDEIDKVDSRLQTISKDLEEIQGWISDEEAAERLKEKREIRRGMEKASDWRNFWIAIISTGLGAGLTMLAQWLFF